MLQCSLHKSLHREAYLKKSILNILTVFILSIVMALSSGCEKEDAVIDLERESVLNDPTLSTYDEVTVRSDDDGQEKRIRHTGDEKRLPVLAHDLDYI